MGVTLLCKPVVQPDEQWSVIDVEASMLMVEQMVRGLICRTGATWDKQHGVDVERHRLLAQTRDLMNKGMQADHLWHTATHADYARPMLQVRSLRDCKDAALALQQEP